jgi:CRP-like cAMP-binding protein
MHAAPRLPTANHLLAALTRAGRERLLAGVKPIELTYGEILYEPGEVMRHVYFPLDCLVSLLTTVDAHQALEVGMIGREGMVGYALALGTRHSTMRALVQGSGMALRVSAARLLAEHKANPALQRALLHYAHTLLVQVSQTAACNRFHEVDARLARWLLMTADRLQAEEFLLTQEFLAQMLGVRRVGVTEAAGVLEKRKIIDYSRGHIHILNRPGLEAAACSCYAIAEALAA